MTIQISYVVSIITKIARIRSWSQVMPLRQLLRQPSDTLWASTITAIGDNTHDRAPFDKDDGLPDPLPSGGSVVDLSHVVSTDRRFADRTAALEFVFGPNVDDFEDTAILATTNESVTAWNHHIQQSRNSSTSSIYTFYSYNSVSDDCALSEDLNSSAFLDACTDNGVPLHELKLAVGDICFLMRTIDKRAGLVTSARVRIHALHQRSIHVCIIGDSTNSIHVIPRIYFSFSPGLSSLQITRRQFPLALAYAMTVNRAQGQTLKRVLLDVTKSPFAHGHLYVALSRVRERRDFALFRESGFTHAKVVTVTYDELLHPMPFAPSSQHQTTAPAIIPRISSRHSACDINTAANSDNSDDEYVVDESYDHSHRQD